MKIDFTVAVSKTLVEEFGLDANQTYAQGIRVAINQHRGEDVLEAYELAQKAKDPEADYTETELKRLEEIIKKSALLLMVKADILNFIKRARIHEDDALAKKRAAEAKK